MNNFLCGFLIGGIAVGIYKTYHFRRSIRRFPKYMRRQIIELIESEDN